MSDKRKKARPAIIEHGVAKIPLGVGAKHGYALVDTDMAWLADNYKWTIEASGRYAVTGTFEVNGVRKSHVYMHRVVMGMPERTMIDHLSRDKLDNRRMNLRLADARINAINTAPRSGGTSIYRGVVFLKRSNKWQAKIKNHGKTIYLGTFGSEEEAGEAYRMAAVDLHKID